MRQHLTGFWPDDLVRSAPVLLLTAFATACAPGVPRIYKNVKNPIELSRSQSYSFDEVGVWRDDRGLTISGRVSPKTYGLPTGHVDVWILNARGDTLQTLSIPVEDRYYRAQWRGAYFEVRLALDLPVDARIRLVLHDLKSRCRRNQAFFSTYFDQAGRQK